MKDRSERRLGVVRSAAIAIAVAAACAGAAPRATAAEFLRGDANGDGRVSVSDAQFTLSASYGSGAAPGCAQAADSNDDDQVNLADGAFLLNYFFLGGRPPFAPYPEPGSPTRVSALSCLSPSGGGPIDDPQATVHVAGVVDSDDGRAVLTVSISSSRPIGAFSGSLLVADDVILPSRPSDMLTVTSLTGAELFFHAARLVEGRIVIGVVASFTTTGLPAGENVAVVEVVGCVARGTRPDTYPITIIDPEFADAETGQTIRPRSSTGALVVGADLPPDVGCGSVADPCAGLDPSTDLDASVRLADTTTVAGGSFALPLVVHSSGPVGGYALSVDFDESLLAVTHIDPVWRRPDGLGTSYAFTHFDFDNSDDRPGSAGVDEGFLVAAVVFEFTSPGQRTGTHRDVELLRVGFDVAPAAPSAITEVRFLDGARTSGQTVRNSLEICSRTIFPEDAASLVFINSAIEILPEITTFIRADSNGDAAVDISDPQHTLGFLFNGAGPPVCFDAADANDDGAVDVSDAIFTLRFLFLDGSAPAAPYPEVGEDPSPDPLRCSGDGA